MRMCSFCGAPAGIKAGPLALCDGCRAALCGVAPNETRYPWFQRAVKQALFGGITRSRPAMLWRTPPPQWRRG